MELPFLATYTNTFISDTIHNAPGYVFIFCLSTAVFLQLYLSCRRYIDYSFPYLLWVQTCDHYMSSFRDRLPPRTLTFFVLICAFIFGSDRFINYVFADRQPPSFLSFFKHGYFRTLNYKLEGLRWVGCVSFQTSLIESLKMYSTRSSEENFYVSVSVGFSMAGILFLYVVAVVFTLIKR